MKGKKEFTKAEIEQLLQLIKERKQTLSSKQKSIRDKMRKLGFYGRDDWGITDCTESDLMQLINNRKITVKDDNIDEPNRSSFISIMKNSCIDKNGKIAKSQLNYITPRFKTIDDLKTAGFEGFVPVAQLKNDNSVIPQEAGVYMVVYTSKSSPEFLMQGTGGFFKGKDPNVPIAELKTNWIENTCVIYIGQTKTTIRKRVKDYLKFGCGQKVGHKGGRYIWQIKESDQLLFCWKPTPDEEPGIVEKLLITQFKEQYGGRRPFANLKD